MTKWRVVAFIRGQLDRMDRRKQQVHPLRSAKPNRKFEEERYAGKEEG
jgi:hypothetical protein